jgi:adenylate kinase family enzyme
MKILIVGYAASGKSTFARKLRDHYNLPLLHIDTVSFDPGWVDVDRAVVEERIRAFMKDHDDWVIDGLYRRLATERFDMCDQLFIFDFNRFRCLWSAITRRIKYHNKERESVAPGCKEKLDPGFIWWILHTGRKKNSRELFKTFKSRYKDKTVVFRNRRDVRRHLESIGALPDPQNGVNR